MLQRMAKYWQRNQTTDSPPVSNRLPAATVQMDRFATLDEPPARFQPPADGEPSASVVLYQRLRPNAVATPDETVKRIEGSRSPLAAVTLKQLGLLDTQTRQHLQAQGICDGAAFIALPCDGLLPRISIGRMKRLQHAVRMAHAIADMRPWQALLLFAIHRRSPNKLASESPGTLYRDIKRFAWSSRGQKLVAGRPQPTAEQVQGWIASARRRRQRQAA